MYRTAPRERRARHPCARACRRRKRRCCT
jgi:hypothetical protein